MKTGFYVRRGKRLFDLTISALLLLLLGPLLVIMTAIVRLMLGKPVLYRQERPGFRERPFVIYKFRTMTEERDAQGNLLPDAERLTRFGLFLRRSSIDELPELLNVVKGEMSLVGPRPLLMEYLGRYSPEQMRRHDVLPGITGWAQVNGRNDTTWPQRFAHDIWYVDHCCFSVDVRILAMTVWKTLKREAISPPGKATMPFFMGPDQS